MSEGVCKIFLKVDNAFKKNGKPDLKKINTNAKYLKYCPMNIEGVYKCEDDIKGINTMCMYLFTELFNRSLDTQKHENNDSQYVEYVMMWLGYRLFHAESYSSTNFMDFYNNNILKSHLTYTFDNKINKKKQLLDANLYYMSRLYQLFNEMCHITLKYSKNNLYMKEMKNDSVRFYNNYKSLYDYINECDSYLSLLNNLKTQYENLKNSLIKDKRNRRYVSVISVNLKNLPHTRQANKTSTIGFDCPKCKKINSNIEKINPKAMPKLPKPKSAGSSPQSQKVPVPATSKKPEPVKPKPATLSQKSDPKPPSPPQQVSAPAPTSPAKPESVKTKAETSLPSESSQQPEKHPPSSPPVQPPVLTTPIQKGSPDSQGVSNSAVDQLSDQGNKSKDSDSDKRNTSSEMGKQGGDIEHKPEQSQDGEQQNSGSKLGDSSGGTGDPPSEPHPPSQDGKSDIKNSLNQSETSSISEGSFGFVPSFLSLLSNGTKIFNRASDFIDQNQQRINDAKDKISGAYKDAMDNLKSIYSASNDYFNSIIDNITTELNQVNTPKSGSSGGNLPQSSDQSKKIGDSLPPQPSDPPIIPPNPSQKKQSSPQTLSTTPLPKQTDTSTQKTNAQINVQLLKSQNSDPISRTHGNIIPTTWNGSGECKPEIKFMNATLVCCTSEQCSLTRVSVTLILIPIILLIVYKDEKTKTGYKFSWQKKRSTIKYIQTHAR
ncbi:PIR protein CIR protein [Plasmodium vinckei vinckei]|uniref:PIR protein CIR protein n=1 Tax=Plasmodium vinckei vinckei TaxID=54757 RepID=A0A449BUK1_PLAVN|nr:PIR protein CIR protein [Plasmodium vinckei vinckei]VEV57135.1 PIR protein CIR protein [Plasmodium vinckei vinckei]